MFLEDLLKLKNSKSYIRYQEYHCNNLFTIIGAARLESVHSNFLKWIFSLNLDNGSIAYPVNQLINMIYAFSEKEEHSLVQLDKSLKYKFLDKKFIQSVNVLKEAYSPVGKNKRYIDILLEVSLKDNLILPIVIENKVNSKEHDDQTVAYYRWAEKRYNDRTKYYAPIYLFLTPEYNNAIAIQKEFMNIKYQDMVDYVIEPTLWYSEGTSAASKIKSYLECLSFQFDDEKGDGIMAITKEEKDILQNFITENKTLICSILTQLDLPAEVKEAVESNVKSYGIYTVNGRKCSSLGNLVYETVKLYVEANKSKGLTFSDCVSAFPNSKLGIAKVIELEGSVSDLDKGKVKGSDGKFHKRFFSETPIEIDDNTIPTTILVSNQWTSKTIEKFIKHAVEELGFNITKNSTI